MAIGICGVDVLVGVGYGVDGVEKFLETKREHTKIFIIISPVSSYTDIFQRYYPRKMKHFRL